MVMSDTRQYPDPVFMFGALRSGTTLLRLTRIVFATRQFDIKLQNLK